VLTQSEEDGDSRVDIAFLQETLNKGLSDLLL
jgi:hypothetical protein